MFIKSKNFVYFKIIWLTAFTIWKKHDKKLIDFFQKNVFNLLMLSKGTELNQTLMKIIKHYINIYIYLYNNIL